MFNDQLIQIKNKLRRNSDFYPTKDLKIIYVASRLLGTALALVNPCLNKDCLFMYLTVRELYTYLKELYSNPNKASNARRDFQSLRMRNNQLFQEFYALFLRLATKSELNKKDVKYELNEKLTQKLQELVLTYYNNKTINATCFAQYCTILNQQNRVYIS